MSMFCFLQETLPDLQGCRVVDHDRIAHFQPWGVWPPPRMPVVNEGLFVGIPDPEHVIIIKDPGGHWNPGRGPHPRHSFLRFQVCLMIFSCFFSTTSF